MFDIRLLRENEAHLREACAAKRATVDLDRLIELDQKRRDLTRRINDLNTERNTASKSIGQKIKAGEDAEAAKAAVRRLGEEIAAAEEAQRAVNADFEALALTVPNPPHATTPVGRGEEDNQVVGHWGEKPAFAFTPKPHWELGETLGILDLPRATKIAGSGFYVLRGAGARLERALINWFIDVHVREFGCVEVLPPHLVNSPTMTGTGQLPKMADDMYRVEGEDFWLIPTAEVPVTNLYAGEIIEGERLPIYHCAFTPCFRKEAGSYGKEVRGITRVHQFDKVEIVKFVRPEASYDEHERLLRQAQTLLERLGLAYRTVLLCSADISFAAAKCYDLEVWAPGMDRWLEVSSCSNFEDFQARRAGIRYRPGAKEKPAFLHTLNGSGLALPRTVIALLETYQQKDGTIVVPEVLRPFMGCEVIK
ncbi:MAG: serine--tRNA ligase [bacterium]|nr:serine--tRNA ligase [bacterium]